MEEALTTPVAGLWGAQKSEEGQPQVCVRGGAKLSAWQHQYERWYWQQVYSSAPTILLARQNQTQAGSTSPHPGERCECWGQI